MDNGDVDKRSTDEVRNRSGGIPVGFKIAASHIEADIDFALDIHRLTGIQYAGVYPVMQ